MRKFARTMDEAFPFGVDYGCAIKMPPKRSMLDRIALFVVNSVLLSCLLALMLAYFDVL